MTTVEKPHVPSTFRDGLARALAMAIALGGCVGPHVATDRDGFAPPSAGESECLARFSALADGPTRTTAQSREGMSAESSPEAAEDATAADFDAGNDEALAAVLEESSATQDGLDETPRERAALNDSDWRRYAVRFDRWLWKEMGDSEREGYVAECRSGSPDPFCSTVKHAGRLEHYASRTQRPYVAPPARVVEPVLFAFRKSTITNWKKIRNADLPPILAGLKALDSSQRAAVEKKALNEATCPNKVSIAVAALLEDSAKTPADYRRISQLFERGAKCTRRHEARDRENYLTRAALYRWMAKDYVKVASLLGNAKPTDAYSGRSLYWLLRAEEELGRKAAAEKTYRRLRTDHALSFHAILAAVERGHDPGESVAPTASPLAASTRKRAIAKFIAQIEQLRAAGRQRSAEIVARLALEGRFRAETDARVYIASLADPYVKVTTMPPLLIAVRRLWTRAPLQVAYPTDFLPAARSAVAGNPGVDPFFLLALCRKESAFDARAVSPADAQGLCQILPQTARRVNGNDRFDLLDPTQNLRIGAKYLQQLFAEFEAKPALAAAAYNAGEEAVRRWRQRLGSISDPVLALDLTPYRETRDYVAQVLGNYFWYRRLYADDATAAVRSLVARK